MKQLNIALILFGILYMLAPYGRMVAVADGNKIVLKNGISVHDIAATEEAAANPQKVGKAYLVTLGKPKSMIRSLAKPSFGTGLSAVRTAGEAKNSNGIVGVPYDTQTNSVVGASSCLVGIKSNSFTNISSDLTFDQVRNQASLFSSLGVSAGLDAGVGPAKLSVTAEFVNSSLDDSKSVNMYFIQSSTSQASISGVVARAAGPDAINVLNGSAQDAYLLSPEKFRALCGNRYVAMARAGARLIVRLTLKFKSEVDKEYFEGKMNLDTGGLLDITAKIKKAVTDTKQDATLTINALQQGGTPLKVMKIFNISEIEARDADASGQTVFPAMECGTASTIDKACKDTIAGIITYGEDTMPEQIKNNTNLYYDLPQAISYATIGLDEGGGTENEQVKLLSAEYAKASKNMRIIDYYALEKFSVGMDVNLTYELKRIATTLNYQIDKIFYSDSIINNCYTVYSPELCSETLKWANHELDEHKLSSDEKADLEYLEHNQYEFGGSGLWRGNKGIGVCGFIPVAAKVVPGTNKKEWQFALDCGLGRVGNPLRKIVAQTSVAEIRIPGLSYSSGEHEITCLTINGPDSTYHHNKDNKELVFKPQSVGSRTYFAQNVKCYKDEIEFGAEEEDTLTLERK
jgi:hypothetical protein